jgi:hypothetical protein
MLLQLLVLRSVLNEWNEYTAQLLKVHKSLRELEALRVFEFIQAAKYLEAAEQREKQMAARRRAEHQRSCASGAVYS